uniref:Uncharacterized protein n=1 Tax=Chromera velia CCMP2878 TaxID=1169474 RepID=A0A0G4I9M7_9ALVE|eukprot:Cvel_2064.t1-p1 / transcript=Cvel_2064.t1 / gene=Cvel_2064 / organism=Chromera_velia_CCMP2878 / gene_product=hypothetical protein / transcript_product=hypothetical protein / location=Cvel_scaffold79:109963-112834(+) / protein_length=196 / sequence_SO=supercontig / SO=protein_coding / is_pseudo=false
MPQWNRASSGASAFTDFSDEQCAAARRRMAQMTNSIAGGRRSVEQSRATTINGRAMITEGIDLSFSGRLLEGRLSSAERETVDHGRVFPYGSSSREGAVAAAAVMTGVRETVSSNFTSLHLPATGPLSLAQSGAGAPAQLQDGEDERSNAVEGGVSAVQERGSGVFERLMQDDASNQDVWVGVVRDGDGDDDSQIA